MGNVDEDAVTPFKAQGRAVSSSRGGKSNLLEGEFMALPARKLSEETCRKFGYMVGKFKGKPVQIAPYRCTDGEGNKQKLRFKDKSFNVIGAKGKVELFGQHLWGKGKRLIITEGEIDAMSLSQVQSHKWPVVSVSEGAKGAAKAIRRNLNFIEQYEEIVFCFDMDEVGRDAAKECAQLLENGKAYIAELPLKDANEMLKAGRGKDLIACMWSAQQYRLDGVVEASSLKEKVLEDIQQGISWPWPAMTAITRGRRYGELYALGAGTGVGKTDVMTQVIEHTISVNKEKVAAIYLEMPPAQAVRRIAGKRDKTQYHNPDVVVDKVKLAETVDSFKDQLYLYDHFGGIEWEPIKRIIRYMALDCGCKHIVIDHLTALAAVSDNEKEMLETLMAELAQLALSLNVCIYVISHLATPDGTPHEEGGRVMLRHFKGSRAIGFWVHYAFGLERNQQHSDPDIRCTTLVRCLKDRLLGSGTGEVFAAKYDHTTGLLNECDMPDSILEREQKKGASDYGFKPDNESDF
jgi:twinkle protein